MRKANLRSFGQVASRPTPVWAEEDRKLEDFHERSDSSSVLSFVKEKALRKHDSSSKKIKQQIFEYSAIWVYGVLQDQ